MAQRILFKDSGLGNSNNPLSGYKFVGYNGLTFSQLDSDGNITPISGSGGSGAVSVDNGLSIESGDIILGGTMSIDTSLAGEGNRLSLSNFSRITAGVSDRFSVYAQSGNGYTSGFSGNDSESSIGYSDSLILGTSSLLKVTEEGISMQSRDNGGAYSSIGVYNTPESVNDGSTDNTFIINDPLNSKGLVYLDDYTSNYSTYSLVHKGYVDALSFASGVSGTGTTNFIPKWTGTNTLSSTSKIYDDGTNVGINNSSPFFQLDIDGSTRIRATESNYELETVAVSGHFYVNHQQIVGGSKNTQLTLDCAGNSYDVGAKLSHYQDGTLEGFSSLYLTPTSSGGAIALISGASGSEFVSLTYSVFFMDSKAVSIGNNQLYWNSTGHTNAIFYVSTTSSNVGIGTSTPDSKAILDLSSTTKGFLPPRMTADQANAAFGTQSTAPEGMLVYITATSSDPAVAACFYNVGWFGRLSTAYWGNTVGWVELTWQVLS